MTSPFSYEGITLYLSAPVIVGMSILSVNVMSKFLETYIWHLEIGLTLSNLVFSRPPLSFPYTCGHHTLEHCLSSTGSTTVTSDTLASQSAPCSLIFSIFFSSCAQSWVIPSPVLLFGHPDPEMPWGFLAAPGLAYLPRFENILSFSDGL